VNDAERLERIEDAVLRLREAASGNAVVVEGLRDRAALEELGVGGEHIVVNQGVPLQEVVDRIAQQAASAGWDMVLLIMDWDRTGNSMEERLHRGLAGRVAVDVGFRARLRRLTHTSSLEEVPAEMASLRRRVGGRP